MANTISSALEFICLCNSDDETSVQRSMSDHSTVAVWMEIIHKYPNYRNDVAQNRTIQSPVMVALLACGDRWTRFILAEKRRLASDLFLPLATDPEEIVRTRIAANRKTPIEILNNMLGDPIESVSRVARLNIAARANKKPVGTEM